MEIADDLAAVTRRIAAIEALAAPRERFAAALDARVRAAPESPAEIVRLAERSGTRYRVDPALIEAVIAAESGFDSNAISSAGARGLMQLMPSTAVSLGVGDSYDSAQNVAAGTRYLRQLLDRFGSVDLAVAAYNAGPNAVVRYGGVPPYPETVRYVREVLGDYRRRLQLGNVATKADSQRAVSIVP